LVLSIKQPEHHSDRIIYKYFLTMTNLFQIIFNCLPQLVIQSVYFSKIIHSQNTGKFTPVKPVLLLVGIKICFALFRISYSSASFVNYFLVNEFKNQNLTNYRGSIFIFFRLLSNIFILGFRFLPLLLISGQFSKTFYFLIFFRYFKAFVFEQMIFISDMTRQSEHIKCNFLSVFWCLVLSVLRTSVLLNEFEFTLLKLDYTSNFFLRVVDSLVSFIETCVIFILMSIFFKIEVFYLTFFFTLIMYFCHLSIEYFYWTVICSKKLFIGENFTNWIVQQCEHNVNIEIGIKSIGKSFIDHTQAH